MGGERTYNPGPAAGAHIDKEGDRWMLVIVRDLRHSPDLVWRALTEPGQLREWAPFDADASLATAGAAGWHLCLDVMDRALSGAPMGRTVGPDAMKLEGWHRLHAEYAQQFGVELPKW